MEFPGMKKSQREQLLEKRYHKRFRTRVDLRGKSGRIEKINGEITQIGYPTKNKETISFENDAPLYALCSNPVCSDGYINIAELAHDMALNRETHRRHTIKCPGTESGHYPGSCTNLFEIVISIVYSG